MLNDRNMKSNVIGDEILFWKLGFLEELELQKVEEIEITKGVCPLCGLGGPRLLYLPGPVFDQDEVMNVYLLPTE